MKVIPAGLIIWFSVFLVSALFYYRHNSKQDDIDLFEHSLKDISSVVPDSATIGYYPFPKDVALYAKAKYTIEPINILLPKKGRHPDTLLTILPIAENDSLLTDLSAGRKIIYTRTDNKYKYYISVGQ